jgi:2-oxoglutarate ferredoxin oxidoreductase subunit gamma
MSENPIGSPLVLNPDLVLALNMPSYTRFLQALKKDGIMIADDSTFVPDEVRNDVKNLMFPAAQMATDAGLEGLGSMIIIGAMWNETKFCREENLDKAIELAITERHKHLLEPNRRAIEMGKKAFELA